MDLIIIGLTAIAVVTIYFQHNPLNHSRKFMLRRFVNWFPLGMTYAFLYMGRYNLSVSKNALGNMMTKQDFGLIFGVGTTIYGLSFLLNGPLVDKIGGKKGIIIAALGSCLANAGMGLATYLFLNGQLETNLTLVFTILYSVNMFFQSYGAVSIIKVKAYWFHVRERGIFGAIFGSLISFGVYFAFDWGTAIVNAAKVAIPERTGFQNMMNTLFAIDTQPVDSVWLVFFIPSVLLIGWALIDMILLKDSPGQAGFDDFDTHDASSGEIEREQTIRELLMRIFTNPIMLTLALVEFTSGVLRNGIMQWYFVFGKEVPQVGAEFFLNNWGLLLCMTGIFGGFTGGFVSDKLFHSRRGPPVVFLSSAMFIALLVMSAVLYTSPFTVGMVCMVISFSVIGVHSLMSGTAAADFGGRRATATASGLIDGAVYLGSGLQSVTLGYLTTKDWQFWPLFLAPFALMGAIFALRMWKDLPEATKRYLATVEKVTISDGRVAVSKQTIKVTTTTT